MVTDMDPPVTNRACWTSGSSSGLSDPPPSASSTIYWLKVSAKPDKGRAIIHIRMPVQPGR